MDLNYLTLWWYYSHFFLKNNFYKNQQTTKKKVKLPSMQRVKVIALLECLCQQSLYMHGISEIPPHVVFVHPRRSTEMKIFVSLFMLKHKHQWYMPIILFEPFTFWCISIHIDTIMVLSILYFKGLQIEFSKLWCISIPGGCFDLSKQCWPWWNAAFWIFTISLSTLLGVTSIQRVKKNYFDPKTISKNDECLFQILWQVISKRY